jgi:hypothetical protein
MGKALEGQETEHVAAEFQNRLEEGLEVASGGHLLGRLVQKHANLQSQCPVPESEPLGWQRDHRTADGSARWENLGTNCSPTIDRKVYPTRSKTEKSIEKQGFFDVKFSTNKTPDGTTRLGRGRSAGLPPTLVREPP